MTHWTPEWIKAFGRAGSAFAKANVHFLSSGRPLFFTANGNDDLLTFATSKVTELWSVCHLAVIYEFMMQVHHIPGWTFLPWLLTSPLNH